MKTENTNHIHKSLEVATFTATHSEPLEKVAKLAERFIRVSDVAFGGISQAVSNLGNQLRDAIIVFESLRFVGIMNFLVTPKNGKYFLVDSANSWQKRLDRVTLAIHCAFKSIKGLNKFGFVDLGVMAKNAIGKLPIFTLTMDSFILASSFFSTWDNLAVVQPKVRKKLDETEAKIEKWEYRPMAIAGLKAGDEIERRHFESKYNAKALELNNSLQGLEKKARLNEDKLQKALSQEAGETQLPQNVQEKIIKECTVESKKLAREIGSIQAKIIKTDGRIAKIVARDCKGLALDLEKTDVNFKIRKWEVGQANAKQESAKNWVKVANSVGKIAVVTLALTLTAINLWTAPFLLTLLGMGILVDSIGLSKILLDEFWKPKPLPRNPVILAA